MISGILNRLKSAFIKDKSYRDTSFNQHWWQIILVTTLGVTTLVWVSRELKWLQSWELKAYDQMLRSRPVEPPDPRILVVTITEEDLAQEKWPLSDATINKLLVKLESHQPRVIALNIYRPTQNNLANGLENPHNIIGTCLFSSMDRSEIPAPANLPPENIGYNDLIPDSQEDQIIRRALLFSEPTDKNCATQFSFAALAAINYLEQADINVDFIEPQNFHLGKTIFPILSANSGSYQDINARGYQILLNYRHPNNLAQTVTLTQVLNNQVNPNWVKDKLVIIGTTAASVHPGLYTPYTASSKQPTRTPAVFIHTQIASQLLSTVLDERPLIWYWPNWVELIWLGSWSLVGSVLGWRLRHPLLLVGVGGTALVSLVGICAGLFLQAGWLPLIPPVLALVMSSVSVMSYTTYRTQQQTKVILLQVEQQQAAIEQLNMLLQETQVTTATTALHDLHSHKDSASVTPEKNTGDFLLSDRYQIISVIASGGFGRTYLAQDTQRPGNPSCVVKQLMPARRDTKFLQVARRLFNTEAEILEVLGKHQQIPTLFAYFEIGEEFYLIEEYIPGHTLNEELPPTENIKSEAFVIAMLKEVLEVLAFIHEHRVIHRDIKPTNIIRSAKDNRLVLIDFGAVKLMQPVSSEETELATVAIGTRGYAPPEQFAGHPRLASDIYALGMMGIQALTGISPQELQPDPETGNVMWRESAEVSAELAEILDKMVRYHFSDRYQSANAVLQDLKQIADLIYS
ncbi:CHASE2 domain-containing serine/threonine-protein kinase [Anabaena sp. UHCC 0399]|uniref:CHASE2 domain-containing serine/threonine-protein kinase n=1 Tax=Anabaena sp. UHCC 0399 TaxID=3110238 RepID=UPI002B21D730|nr:CHASE2 domain-containing serine/threonine-protein kinase [Anabaena sp. UHCC 0399]MEA5566722.1 CHASE2 domain-containing serine/threonine-protein kinase [Anabaena sp. UHCC 0399]